MIGLIFFLLTISLVVLGITFWVWTWWRIFEKAGYHGAFGLLMVVPIANAVMVAFLSFSKWPVHEQMETAGLPSVKSSKPMPTVWIVLAAFASAIPVIAMLAAIAIPNLLRAKLSANEALAKNTLRIISTGAETYAVGHEGKYPNTEDELKSERYMANTYHGQMVAGYSYRVELSTNGYQITAQPLTCNTTGTKVFQVQSGGILEERPCEMPAAAGENRSDL